MSLAPIATSARTAAGLAGGLLAGAIFFRGQILDPTHPAFRCVAEALIFAAILGFVRARRYAPALFLPVAWAAAEFGLSWGLGLPRVVSQPVVALVLGGGFVVLALLFDRLAEEGYAMGKFLIVGPLVGALYLAATPMSLLGTTVHDRAVLDLWVNLQLGMVLGDGVGFGVELADLALRAAGSKAEIPRV